MIDWTFPGFAAGILLSYGIGSTLLPDASIPAVLAIVGGASILGAIIGSLASTRT